MGGDAASSAYANMLPQTLTSSIMSGGGTGIAMQIAKSIDPALAYPTADKIPRSHVMTVVAHETDAIFTGDVLAHLDAQLVSARRLLQVVLEQGAAIRRRDVKSVVALTGILQAELQRRSAARRRAHAAARARRSASRRDPRRA